MTVTGGKPSVTPPKAVDAARFADLLPLLKLHRAELVQKFAEPVECELCGRTLDGEDRIVVPNNPLLCDRAGAWAVKNKQGVVIQAAGPRCPFKERS